MAGITQSLLKLIIADQKDEQIMPSDYHIRSLEVKLEELSKNNEIIVITGVRRSGKSVLLHRIRKKEKTKDYYFNFEDERLATFNADDFQMLYEVFLEVFGDQKIFYFDEIQNIPGWEMFIRRLYNAGNKIFITGSNAALFSEELGTRLTGRYIKVTVYPFSFYEYIHYQVPELTSIEGSILSTKNFSKLRRLFNHFCNYGGIPEYVRHRQVEYLHSLYEGIIYRDIVVRYNISNVTALKQLVFFLASNCSKIMTYSALRKLLQLGSATTVSDYCSYLENSYLCFFINCYSASLKVQQQAPKKVYFVDHALAKIVGFRFSEDKGRMLENIVFIELKRRYKSIYYFQESKECDFVIQQDTKIIEAIQVCQELIDPSTYRREVEGLLEAMEYFSLKKGYILTESEEYEKKIRKNNKTYKIIVMPIWKWLLGF